ncbi:MAG: hypothetical protein KH452_08640 [Clostridiales bacterium]|nr:hypothetical protein [Clostridiales bacterium]
MRNRILSVGIVFIMIFGISGCQKSEAVHMAAETNKGEQQEQEEEPEQVQQQEEEPEQTPEQAQPEERDYYEELIAAARECAVKNNGEKPENYDFSSVIYVKKDWDYGTLGYLIDDIDGNGTDELIFGGNADESDSWFDGIIYDIYTISDGELVHVLNGWERNRYFLCENGMIANEGSGSAFESTNSYFTLEGDVLDLVEAITWTYNGEDETWVYYYMTESEYDTENAEIISEEQADAVIEKYVYAQIAFIPFAEE